MRLYEHEAKRLFASRGIPVPESFGLIRSTDDLETAGLSYPAMIKAMVLTGGRGKQGGVKKVSSPAEAAEAVEGILSRRVGDYVVEALLAEQAVTERSAGYLGITLNPDTYRVIVLASALGGVDIEKAALEHPDAVLRREIPGNDPELPEAIACEIGEALGGGDAGASAEVADIAAKLYATFQAADAKVAEINPVIVTEEGRAIAADAKVVIDDNALFRQRRLFRLLGLTAARHDASELTKDEERARDAGFPYVDLLPPDAVREPGKIHVGLVPGGAGYGIFSIDEAANVGERFFDGRVVPVNFMDSGGGPTLARVAEMFHLLMDKEIVDLIVTSRFGGISSCDVFIRGLIACIRERHADGRRVVPVSGRMVGTDLPGARAFLEMARRETPDTLRDLDIIVGNQRIMADVIKDAVAAFEKRGN